MTKTASKDGTQIAYDEVGSGPPLVLVDGAFCRRDFGPMATLAKLLADRYSVIYYDRRGRGESEDTKPYAVEREVEDLAAVVAVATRHGSPVNLYGASSGAALAIRGVASGLP